MPYAIPFNRPSLAGNEQPYMAQAIANGHLSGDGQFTTIITEEQSFHCPRCNINLFRDDQWLSRHGYRGNARYRHNCPYDQIVTLFNVGQLVSGG